MKMPFRRSKSLPERLLQMLAKAAGVVRRAVMRKALRPHPAERKVGRRLARD